MKRLAAIFAAITVIFFLSVIAARAHATTLFPSGGGTGTHLPAHGHFLARP
jgi:hypothetical protein